MMEMMPLVAMAVITRPVRRREVGVRCGVRSVVAVAAVGVAMVAAVKVAMAVVPAVMLRRGQSGCCEQKQGRYDRDENVFHKALRSIERPVTE